MTDTIPQAFGNPTYPVLVISSGAQRASMAFRSVTPSAFRYDLTLVGISNVNAGAFGAFRVVLTRG